METEFKICKECKYVKTHRDVGYICIHPKTLPHRPNLVTGEYRVFADWHQSPWRLRSDESKCGPEGKWWESKDT